jgi:glycosyltransferase involved in cell wall biosynthesis
VATANDKGRRLELEFGKSATLKTVPLLSVIVVTYKRLRELGLVLEAVEKQREAPPFEVIIVDNDTQASAKNLVMPFIRKNSDWRYEVNSTNNVSRARNLGANCAKTEWLAFLDDDCVPPYHWLQMAELIIKSQPADGLIFGGGYEGESMQPGKVPLEKEQNLPVDAYLVEGNLFFRRNEYIGLGGMRPELGPSGIRFGYHEGTELQLRHIKRYGKQHRRYYDPKLAVHHLAANPKNKLMLACQSGFDAVAAFNTKEEKGILNSLYHLFKVPMALVRVGTNIVIQREMRLKASLYRLGEVLGHVAQGLSELGRGIASWIRFTNNRLTIMVKTSHDCDVLQLPPLSYAQLLRDGRPFAAGKIGTAEILGLDYFDRFFQGGLGITSWVRPATRLANNAGFFPVELDAYRGWNREMRASIAHLDFVCLWQTDPFLRLYESEFVSKNAEKAQRIPMGWLGKSILHEIADFRCLVISPFIKTMQMQLPRMRQIHDPENQTNTNWEKLASNIRFLRCPLQWHLEPSPYRSWAEGLEILSGKVAQEQFDVAVIGAGAWSLPLAAQIKKSGRSAIHTGGETQLFFGIKGQRWNHIDFYNSAWVSVLPEETPELRAKIDDACYW